MAKKRLVSVSLLLASLALVGAGCGQSASVSVNAPAAPAERQPTPHTVIVAGSDTCGNPYYPFKSGLAITYGVTSSASASANPDYTLRVVDVSGTSATLRAEMANGVSAEMQADCASGTVALKGSFDLASAAQGLKLKTTIVSSSGTYVPSDVAVGSAWSNAQTVKAEATGGTGADMGPITTTTTTSAQEKAVAQESVTVPAGTYDALKIEVTRTTSVELSGMPAGVKLPPGVKIPSPAPTVTTSTEWWVKGIGMVKSVSTSGKYVTTVEAKSITGA